MADKALVIAINSWLGWQYHQGGPLTATLVVEADGVPKITVAHSEQVTIGDGYIVASWPAQGDRYR